VQILLIKQTAFILLKFIIISPFIFYIITPSVSFKLSTNMSTPRIAIIGAGPGGLMLARLLQHNNISCTVFELDLNQFSRDQGGIIDLHPRAGQLALKEGGLLEEFNKHSLPEAEASKLVKADGTIVWNDNGEAMAAIHAGERPEIDRSVLRGILVDSIEKNSIKWSHKLVSLEATGDNKYDLHFSDSTTEKGFDLVVGADGAWSKVRPLITPEVPFYSGITMIELQAHNVTASKPWLAEYAGTGSLFMFDEGRAVICQRNAHADNIRVYAGVRQPENWIKECGIDWTAKDTARGELIDRYFGDCGPDLKRAILEASDTLTARALYMLPVGLSWGPRAGLTLLGDAAHLMTPFAGVGVNVALADALELARALIKRKDKLDAVNLAEALKEYEESMFVRGEENMAKTWKGLEHHFSATGIDERVGKLQERDRKIAAHMAARKTEQASG
jgi:2-polyprenyl-6-methoxyphenol hydroxylase-like FAD-dependent oxidoreductase